MESREGGGVRREDREYGRGWSEGRSFPVTRLP